ncbi:MAG TPA: transposase, partial [Candidatus Avamphibacillus intestinigallinarum]|nr:transposase [Candidatus Avamphibacillus intestinigallinarum]
AEVLHADETSFKVLADKERQKSYMWLFSTGVCGNIKIQKIATEKYIT